MRLLIPPKVLTGRSRFRPRVGPSGLPLSPRVSFRRVKSALFCIIAHNSPPGVSPALQAIGPLLYPSRSRCSRDMWHDILQLLLWLIQNGACPSACSRLGRCKSVANHSSVWALCPVWQTIASRRDCGHPEVFRLKENSTFTFVGLPLISRTG